jgi:hypothetical protein
VILMQTSSNDFKFLVGDFEIMENLPKVPALPMFSEYAVDFLAALSREILKDKRSRQYVDVTSYAYWIRKTSVENAKAKHLDYRNRIGRGVAFHVAPSNVPVNFAVSMTSSILAGNATIIRVSNKNFEQVEIICDAMNKLLGTDFKKMRPYFCLIRYDHNDIITQELSSICDVRIIWGGDKTIETIRKASIPPRAVEMAFADRYSIAVINSDQYLESNREDIAKGFYTDTYYTDQNACSSPRIVIWTGTKTEEARKEFWISLDEIVARDYRMKPIQAVDKYTSFCMLGMLRDKVHLISENNYVVRVEVDRLFPELMDYKNGGGYFFEYIATDLCEIIPILGKQCQTVSFLGESKERIKEIVFENGVRGVDRIVPLGQTMGLEFIWDGYKMIENMSRFVYMGEY